MGFWGKTTKIVSIVAITLGGGLAIGGATMLGISSNKIVKVNTSGDIDGHISELGVGFSNYGTADGQISPYRESSYEEWIKKIRLVKETPGLPQSMIDFANTAIQTYDTMIAGAVLLPIGSITAILGVVFLILNIKKVKVA